MISTETRSVPSANEHELGRTPPRMLDQCAVSPHHECTLVDRFVHSLESSDLELVSSGQGGAG